MNSSQLTSLAILGLSLIFSQQSFAIGDAAKPLQQQWAEVKYQTPEKAREDAFESGFSASAFFRYFSALSSLPKPMGQPGTW